MYIDNMETGISLVGCTGERVRGGAMYMRVNAGAGGAGICGTDISAGLSVWVMRDGITGSSLCSPLK